MVDKQEQQNKTTIPTWHRLPNTSFGIGMGLAGQASLWSMLHGTGWFELSELFQIIFWSASLAVTTLFLALYLLKLLFYWNLVADELNNPVRVHFFNMPHLILMLLALAVPDCLFDDLGIGRQIIWGIAFCFQVGFTSFVYEDWLFSKIKTIQCAQPQFLLSTVGWMLLATLGAVAKITERWGLALPEMCFGVGIILYFMVTISIFNSMHQRPAQQQKGSPALFLLMAAPSIGAVALDLLEDIPNEFAAGSYYLLGWSWTLVLLLVRIGPQIARRPPVLGAYWAYVFPLSSLATASLRYAWEVSTIGSQLLAFAAVMLSFVALAVVFVRMSYHTILVALGEAEWTDPLLSDERLVGVEAVTHTELVEDWVEAA